MTASKWRPWSLCETFASQFPAVTDVNDLSRTQSLRGFQPYRSPPGHRHVAAEIFRQRDEHQANRTGADDEHVLPGAQLCVLHSLDDAGERLDERGVAEIGFRFEPQQIFLDEPRGNDNGFGISAVQKQQIFAEIFLAATAVKTFAARRGIGRHDAVANDFPVPALGRSDICRIGVPK